MKKHTTWVVIADGSQGRILSSDGLNKGLVQVGADLHGINAPDRDLGRDEPGINPGGRTQRPPGAPETAQGSHAATPRISPHDKAERAFLSDVADRLLKAANRGAYERLVLVAPPAALGTLRKQLDKSVLDKVIGEVDKDLTNIPLPQLPEHLSLYVGF